jgi:hypothetical protein
MFRGSSAHLQKVSDVNCTCMQPLVCSFSAGGRLVHKTATCREGGYQCSDPGTATTNAATMDH